MTHSPILGIIRIFLKNSKAPLLWGKLKNIDLKPKKNHHLFHFEHNKSFLRERAPSRLIVFWNLTSCKNQKKVISQCWEKGTTDRRIDRWPDQQIDKSEISRALSLKTPILKGLSGIVKMRPSPINMLQPLWDTIFGSILVLNIVFLSVTKKM